MKTKPAVFAFGLGVPGSGTRICICSNCGGQLARAFASALVLAGGMACTHASNVPWSNTGGTAWLTGTNWTGGAVPGTADVAQFGVNPNSATALTITMSNTTNNGTANQAVGAIEITSERSSGAVTISNHAASTNGTLTLNGATVNGVSNVILRNNSSIGATMQNGTSTMAVALANSIDNVVVVDGSGNFTVSSNISGTSKHLTAQGSGSGDFILSGTNSFTGGISVSGSGRLRLEATTALPTTGDISVSESGRLRFSVVGTFGANSQTTTFNPDQTNTPAMDLQVNGIAVILATKVAFNAATLVDTGNSTSSLEVSGNLSGSGNLLKQGGGNLIISGTGNAATGGTRITNGTVAVSSGSLLGTGALTLAQASGNDTTLTLNNTSQSVGSLNSSWTQASGTRNQRINLNDTALTVNQTTDGTFGTGAVASLTSTIAGTGTLIKNGAAMLTLSSANSYSGGTTIKAGTLALGSTGSIASSSSITVGDGGSSNAVLDTTAKAGLTIGKSQTLAGIGTVNVGSGKILTIEGIHSVGNSGTNAGVGTQTVTGNLSYASDSIFNWDLNECSTTTGFDKVATSGSVTVSNSGTVFNVVLGTTALAGILDSGNVFWNTPQGTQSWSMASIFGQTIQPGSQFASVETSQDVSSYGSFTINGSSLTWTAVPEPTSALAGIY